MSQKVKHIRCLSDVVLLLSQLLEICDHVCPAHQGAGCEHLFPIQFQPQCVCVCVIDLTVRGEEVRCDPLHPKKQATHGAQKGTGPIM